MKDYLCEKCKQSSSLEFYKGCKNLCKICYRDRVKVNRLEKSDYYKEYDRKRADLPHRIKIREAVAERWRNDPEKKKRTCELKRRWQEKNRIKRAAHVLTGNAIRDGRLIKEPCEVCGATKVDAHHDDYMEPMIVRWLCKKHHDEHHKKERENERTTENKVTNNQTGGEENA